MTTWPTDRFTTLEVYRHYSETIDLHLIEFEKSETLPELARATHQAWLAARRLEIKLRHHDANHIWRLHQRGYSTADLIRLVGSSRETINKRLTRGERQWQAREQNDARTDQTLTTGTGPDTGAAQPRWPQPAR